MNNKEIRFLIQCNGLKYWEVAAKIGVSDSYFSRMLRNELNDEKKEEVIKAINDLTAEKGVCICIKKVVKQ